MVYKKCIITNIKKRKGVFYDSTYLITINGDIVGFSKTIREAKKIIDDFINNLKNYNIDI